MRKNIFFQLVLGFMVLSFWSCQQTNQNKGAVDKTDPKEVREVINKKNKEMEALMKEGNIDSASTFYADNLIQMVPHREPLEGKEAFIKMWKEHAGYGEWDFKINTKEVKVCGEMAAERGEFILKFKPKENSPMPAFKDHGNYVVLWERIDGDWKIAWDAPVIANPMEQDTIPKNLKDAKVTAMKYN